LVPFNIQLKNPTLLFYSDSPKKSFNLKHFPSEKENEHDPTTPKPAKGRSPLITSTPKGSPFQKNFMAPTISASSKAVGSSFQRKRVLGERNEMVHSFHTSALTEDISGPAVRFQHASTQVEENTNCSSFISSPQIKETVSLSALSPAISLSPSTGPATTQSDPLEHAPLPPYDPKVNYLSPRPQFLHYKPKPRDNLFGNELDFFGSSSDSTGPEDSSSSECSDDIISVQTEEEDNLLKEATIPEVECPKIELQPSRVTTIGAKLKIRHVLLVLSISCICLLLLASYSNPNVPSARVSASHTRLLEVSNKINGWLSEYFSYTFAREGYFPREISTFPLANLTCVVDDNRSFNEAAGKYPSSSWEIKMGMVSEEKETQASFDMVHGENEVSEEQIQHETRKLEKEGEVEDKEEDIEVGSASEHQEMAASSIISETKEDPTQPDMFEKSEPEKPKILEHKLVENQEVEDLETIMSENLKTGKLEKEGEVEDKEEEEDIEVGSASEHQEMVASSIISETKEDPTQPDMFEKSEPEKPKISEHELVENQEVKDLETIMSETLKPESIEPKSGNMSDGELLINILKKTAQGMVAIAVLLSLATAVAASAYAKRKQNQVPVSNSIRGDKAPGLVQSSSESHVPNMISLQKKSTLDIEEFSSSSFKVGTDAGIFTNMTRERQARRESEASSGSYGSYMSFEKISSKKVSISKY
jgi:hypothetical protein